jgi:quinol monooxygenase YgiN
MGATGTEINVVVTQRIHPGREAEFEALLRELEASTVANDAGCLRYEWYRAEAPQTYILLERWTDLAAVQAHFKAPHMVAIGEKYQSLVPEKFTFVRLSKV